MKMLVGLLFLAISFTSIASTGESKTFTYNGTQNSVELILRGEKTHTEYRYENRTVTCYRTEIVGYRTICTGGPGPGPGPGYPGPRPYPRNCYQEPVYRQIAYPCTQTVQIPYEVKDFDVDARVLISVSNLSAASTPGENFIVNLQGDNLSIQTQGSKKFFLMLKKLDNSSRMNGNVKFIDANYSIELIEAAPVLKALNMTNISIENSVLNFNLGLVTSTKNIGFSLKVLKKKVFGDDIVLFDRELSLSEIIINANNSGSAADVNVEKLGVNLEEGKYSLTAKAFFKAEGTLMNQSQFSDLLETSKTLIYKIR